MSKHAFSHAMLPNLGVRWHYFPTSQQAQRFAIWAERETVDWEYPCEAFINRVDERPESERWEVKVKNW